MKKKSLFRKATALICCIAMCITTFMPAIYAAGNGEIVVTSNEVKLYNSEGLEITGSGIWSDDDYFSYTVNESGSLVFGVEGGGSIISGDMIVLYVKDTVKPVVTPNSAITATVEKSSVAGFTWEIGLLAKSNIRKSVAVSIEPGKAQYTVSFSSTDCDILNADTNAPLNGTYTYNEGDVINFTVDAGSQLGKTVAVLQNRTTPIIPTDNVYSVTVNSNMTISAKVDDEILTVKGPSSNEQIGYTYTPASSETVTYGGSFSFYVTPVDGWTVPTVKNGGTVLTSVGNNLYVINNITASVTITVEKGSPVDHGVVYPTGVGYTASGDPTVKDGSNLEFTVAPSDAAYEIKSVTATVGGKVAEVKPFENEANKYTILNVKGDVVISVNAQKKMLDVTVDTSDMANKATTTAADGKVEYGTQYSFYVTPAEGHGNATVYLVNGETETPVNPVTVNGTQYVVTVTKDTVIKIVGADLNSYTVTLNNGTGFVYQSAAQSVQHNGTYTFDVKVDEAYNKSEPVVSVNNVVIAATNDGADGVWKYEIKNVTENKVVSVSGLQRNTYKVTLQGGAGYNFSTNESTTVEYNGSFTFRVDIMSGYKANNLVVKYGETTVAPDANGNYVVNKIKDNITVSVSGVELATSKITDIKPGDSIVNVTSGNENSIVYNGYVTFTVEPKVGYRVENVFVNGERKDALDGTYRVNNITSNITIDVRTVANKLTVNYVSTEKNHEINEIWTYDITNVESKGVISVDNSCIVHSFNGWFDGEIPADVTYLKTLIENAKSDSSVTLTADFSVKAKNEINTEFLMKLNATTKEQSTVGAKYRTTFRTGIDIIAKVGMTQPCVMDYVKVTAHGTLLANSANVDFAGKVDALKGRDKTSTGEMNGETVVDKTMFNYYVNCNYTWSDFYAECQNPNNAQIVLRVTSNSKENSLNAAGWVELSIGDTNIYIISGESGQDVTVAAK